MSDIYPRISVITVVFNNAKNIERTILSVVEQDYQNLEYIIIDGNSDDGTLDIIQKYEDKISRWISEPDEGLYFAMNKGLEFATGDYVWFINSGDEIFDGDTVSKMISGLDELPDILYGNTMITDKEGGKIGDRRLVPPKVLTWKSFKRGMLVSHQSLIVKRELAPAYDTNYTLASDIDWVIRAMKAAVDIRNTHIYLSRFMEGGVSRTNLKTGLKERFAILARHYGWIPTALRHIFFGFRLAGFYLRHRRI